MCLQEQICTVLVCVYNSLRSRRIECSSSINTISGVRLLSKFTLSVVSGREVDLAPDFLIS